MVLATGLMVEAERRADALRESMLEADDNQLRCLERRRMRVYLYRYEVISLKKAGSGNQMEVGMAAWIGIDQ
jgi:hypothetical protein